MAFEKPLEFNSKEGEIERSWQKHKHLPFSKEFQKELGWEDPKTETEYRRKLNGRR